MRRIASILVLFTLTGCVKYVYIPVATCPKPPSIKEQVLKVDTLKDGASTDDTLRALVYDLVYLKALKDQYRTLLEGYNTPQWTLDKPKP